MKTFYLGIHINDIYFDSLINALEITKKLGAHVLQIYLGDKRLTTLRKKMKFTNDEIKIIKSFLKENDIKFVVHAILSLNFCNDPHSRRNQWGIDNLVYDMNLCNKLGGFGVVIHMGTHKTKKINITYEQCSKNFIDSLILVLDKTKKIFIILETPVNRPNIIGGTIEKMASLYNLIPIKYKTRVKICIDTQHIFVSGYNFKKIDIINNYFETFDKLIGLKNLALIHLNDSDKEFNSKINRHQTTGKGFIFSNSCHKSLQHLLHLAHNINVPLLLETNYEQYSTELLNLKKLFQQVGGNKKKDIKDLILTIFNKILDFHQALGNKGNSSTKFRIDSYKKAIKSIENYNGKIYNSSNVKKLSSIGKGFSEKIDEIAKTGTLKIYQNALKNKVSNSIKIFQKIWGIGPKLAQDLVNKKIYTIKDLKKAIIKKNIVLTTQQKLGLKYYKDLNEKIPRYEITIYTQLLKKLFENNNIKIHNAGSYRMGKEMSGDIDIIITLNDISKISEFQNIFYETLVKNKIIVDTLLKGNEKNIFIVKIPINNKFSEELKYRQMDVAFIDKKYLPFYLLYFGSSREYSKKIRTIASKTGYKLNDKGLYDKKTGKKINFEPKTERDIFDFLKIEYLKPENRK
jgi:apurinic endonuclease APN1